MRLSSAVRLVLVTAMVGAGSAVLPAATAQAAVVPATLVKTTWTGGPQSTWVHPSPDPSGITYNSRTGRLIISDGEVEETGSKYPKHVWMGTNVYVASLQGDLLETGANTIAYSAEPVGVGFRPATTEFPERLFFSDDNADLVFEVDRGADDRYGTPDDTVTSFSTRFTGSSSDDAEDVAVVLGGTPGELLIVDGLGQEVYVYSWGPNKVFDGLPAAGGDDTVRQFDVAVHGARDPEGIAYNPYRNTIFVVDSPSNSIYELNMQGGLENIVTLPFRMTHGAGIALAPPSNGSGGAPNAYIVDRGVDNDGNPDTFNDGRLYEVAIPGLTGVSGAPGTPPPPPPPSAGLLRYSHNFNTDQTADVIAARPDGALILYPGNGRGGFLGSYPQIGAGWNSRDMIRHGQDFDRNGTRDVIARNPSNGNLWLYKGNGSGGFSGQVVNGYGWNVFTEIVAPGDFNGDGNPDLLTVRSNGAMNLYPGNGTGGFGSTYPQIGVGWQTRDQIISVGDWNGDGRHDLVAREPGTGHLWLYVGNGTGGFASQQIIGTGWNIFSAIVGSGDFNGDGANDLLARRSNGDLYLYPGNGRGGFGSSYPKIGAGWSSLRIASAGQQ